LCIAGEDWLTSFSCVIEQPGWIVTIWKWVGLNRLIAQADNNYLQIPVQTSNLKLGF
jgi:hypothetical protein